MIRALFLVVLVPLALAGCDPTPTTGAGGVPIISPRDTDAIITRHVDTVNAFRAENGMGPVQVSPELTAAARTHARDMSVQKRAWHFGSDGTSPKDRADRAGYRGQVTGENISESFDDEFTLIQSWLSDPSTRRVMANPRSNEIGFGWYQETNGKLWWVQVLGQRGAQGPLIGG